MSALAFGMILVGAAPCFTATDASPGWKQAILPEDALSLAAPEGIDQLRSGEEVTVVDERSGLYLVGRDEGPGRIAFDFSIQPGGRSLEVTFTEGLKGAKVDVVANGDAGSMSLMHEERIGSSRLNLSWGQTQVHSVTVRVHNHLRKDPVLEGWRSVRRVPLSKLQVSEAFQLERSLYYRQPPGAAVLLCNEPGRELRIAPEAIGPRSRPTPVALVRRP
jgi:hypothetical protein